MKLNEEGFIEPDFILQEGNDRLFEVKKLIRQE